VGPAGPDAEVCLVRSVPQLSTSEEAAACAPNRFWETMPVARGGRVPSTTSGSGRIGRSWPRTTMKVLAGRLASP